MKCWYKKNNKIIRKVYLDRDTYYTKKKTGTTIILY